MVQSENVMLCAGVQCHRAHGGQGTTSVAGVQCHGTHGGQRTVSGVCLHHLFLRQGLSCWPMSFWMVLGSLLLSFLRSAHHFGLSVVSGLNMGHQTGKCFCHLSRPQARLQR